MPCGGCSRCCRRRPIFLLFSSRSQQFAKWHATRFTKVGASAGVAAGDMEIMGQIARWRAPAGRFAPSLILVAALLWAGAACASSRIKDLASVEGVRENQLIGYGLVVGLNGTGDTINNSPFTRQSITAMLERLGVNIRGQNLNLKNVAAVMVTANLPAFSTQGTRIDVTVSALGDAKSLQGGTLLVT